MLDPKVVAAAIKAAQSTAAILPMGGAAVTAGKAVLDLVDALRGSPGHTGEQVAQFEASRAELERAVNAHADRTAQSLGG